MLWTDGRTDERTNEWTNGRSGPTTRPAFAQATQVKIRRRRLFKKVQAFCEEKVLRYLLGIFFGMLNPKTNAVKLKMASSLSNLHTRISKMAANWRKIHKNL